MRKPILYSGIFVIAVLLILLIVPSFIPAEFYRSRIIAAAQSATGRTLRIDGPLNVTLFPTVGVEATNVGIANASGGAAKEMATLSKLEVGLKLLPLASGTVEVDRFVLVDPVIHLEIDKNGRPNWEFGSAAAKPATAAAPAASTSTSNPAEALRGLQLGEVKIVNGTVDYTDARTNSRQEASKVDVTVKLPDLDREGSIDGSVTWKGKAVKLTVSLDRPRALFANAQSTAKVKLSSDMLNLTFDGTVAGGKQAKLTGAAALDVPSVRELATWTGTPLTVSGTGLGAFSLKGNLAASGSSMAFNDAAISLDAIKGKGDLSVDTSGSRPAIKGKLDIDALDLNPYVAKPNKAAPAGSTQTAASNEWSDAPIDLSALKAADLNFTIGANAIKYGKIEVGKSALAVNLKDGRLAADLTQLALYGGSGKGQVTVDAAGTVPALDTNFTLNGVQAQPALAAIMDFDRVTGAGNLDFSLNSRGRSQREMVGALGGKGGFAFTNGAIKGIDLAAMSKNIGQAFAQAVSGSSQQTEFAELSGHFTVANGIAKNDDLTLKSPAAQMAGAGTVDLPRRTIDYRVEPKVAVAGQNISVPILIQGPWSNVGYQPDLKGVLGQQLSNPSGLLKGITGAGASSSGSGGSTGAAKSTKPADVLKGILGK